MPDYPAEVFPYVFICSWCEAKQPVTRQEAIEHGGHLPNSEGAAASTLENLHGWTHATPTDLVCPECADEEQSEEIK